MLFGFVLLSVGSLVNAQAVPSSAVPLTRAQVIQERDEYLKTHFYDTMNEVWVSHTDIERTYGRKSRDLMQSEQPDTEIAKKQ